MHGVFIKDLIQLSSTCFEQLIVHHQEGCTNSFTVFYRASI